MNLLRSWAGYVAARRGDARWRDRAALERWQEQQVVRHLRRVLPRSPWLRERFGTKTPEQWREVPVTGKAEAMARFGDWNTAGISRKEAMEAALRAEETRDFSPVIRGVSVGLSSGTTGSRGLFLTSPAEQAHWAGSVLGKLLPYPEKRAGAWRTARDRVLPEVHRVALFLRSGGNLYEASGRGRVGFRWFDLMRPAAPHWKALAEWAPTVLVAPPTLLRELAAALARGAGDLSGIPWSGPRRIVSCAETLDRLDRQMLEEAFGQGLHEIYQATEGFLAATDQSGTLRLCEDGIVVEREWVDAARTRFVPVITDFRRTTQPFVRHRLDDVLVAADERADGGIFTALEAVEGRQEDTLVALTPQGRVPVFGDSVVRAVIRAADVRDFRVVQESGGGIRVSVEPDTAAVRECLAGALRTLWQEAGGAVEITFSPMPPVGRPGDKRRRIRRSGEPG